MLIIVMLLAIVGKDVVSPGNWRHDFKVQLGLDLAGGTSVTEEAQTISGKAPSASDMAQARAIMIARVNGAGFSGAQVQQQGSNNIVVTVPGANTQKVVRLVGTTAQLLFRQVLLVGNSNSTASPSTSPTSPATSPTPSSSSTPGASSSPSAKASSSPSTKASSSPKAAGGPGSAAQSGGQGLASGSRLLAASKPKPGKSGTPAANSTPSPSTSPSPAPTTPAASQPVGDPSLINAATLKIFNKLNCADKNWRQQIGYTTSFYDNPNNQIVTCNFNPNIGFGSGTKIVLDKAKVLGKDVTGAQASTANSQQSLSGKWLVNVSLNRQGTAAFGALTSQLVSKYYRGAATSSPLDDVAIVLDGQIVSAPQIQQAIPGGSAQITYFPQAEAQNLANELNYGALPVTFKQQNIESVSPELGRNQLTAGLIAAAIGLGLVVIYSFLYYRGLGIVSVSSLIVAGILAFLSVVLLSKYSSSGFSLSLSGIAGLIVAIGITADSFVVYFERLRDEVRDGKSLRPAVESGWKRARRTILVSDTVSFLAALLLWYFSISDVKGFAFTLGLTTIIDVVVVFLFTKPMVTILARTKFFSSGHPLSGLDPARLGARTPWRSGVPRTARRAKEA
ncbi:MAG TPA: protein translocase subunit SecD [Streptosporangiaceae bacterium]